MSFNRRRAATVYGATRPMGSYTADTKLRTIRCVIGRFRSSVVLLLTTKVSRLWFHFKPKSLRLLLTLSRTGETKFVFGSNLCYVGRRFIKKHATAPQWMVVLGTRLGLVPVPFEDALEAAETKTFASVFVRVTDGALSSFLGFVAETFIFSCATALSFNDSLKSKRVGRLQFFLTLCIDQASFMFGGSFCTAWPNSAALDKSCSYFKERKTPTNAEMVAEKAFTFSLFASFTVPHFQQWEATQFVQMGPYNSVWLAKFTLESLRRFLIHCAAICKLSYRCLGLASYKRFQVRKFHIVREWC